MKSDLTALKTDLRSLSLSLAMSVSLLGQSLIIGLPAGAQIEQSSDSDIATTGLTAHQRSLIPPEVIPVQESKGTDRLRETEVKNLVMGATSGQLAGIEPSATPAAHPVAPQSARQMRQDMFKSLMGNPQLAAQMAQYQPLVPNQLGQPAQEGGEGVSPTAPDADATGQSFGQPDWLASGGSEPSMLTAYGGGAGQTQTLTAGSKIPMVRRDIRRSGTGNTISGLAGFGSSILYGGTLLRPNSLLGLGVTGLTLTGFGIRNGFRF